jgi:NADPH-dependent 2,4-dienoyl-CoA reductase/sulfur reductase-like enzyme/nitrite reductase/ring-hydroxylating ferredoxin subunit
MSKHQLGLANELLQNGQMKQFEVAEQAIVLAKIDNEYFAFGASCTHYGASLDRGALRGYTVMCPWHHACFDIRTGARLEPPALSGVNAYPVHIEDGQVVVELEPVQAPEPEKTGGGQTFIIVGGGAAGQSGAEELRKRGFAGQIIILNASGNFPVDRPNISKEYLAGDAKPEWMPLHEESWYEEQQIDLRRNTRVTNVNLNEQSVTTDDGITLHYDKLLLASGSHPRELGKVPGADLANIFTLREQIDADRIIKQSQSGQKAVIVGASFIGMEVAYSLASRGMNITVIGLENVPYETILGKEVGQLFQQAHEKNGVQFRLDNAVEKYEGQDGRVTGVTIKNGETLPADFVVLGVGVTPTTDFLSDSGITVHDSDHSVMVNEQLQTSNIAVYAAGDIARYPYNGDTVRIEHWRVAQQQGMVAARNMLGLPDDMDTHIPFFWTNQWDIYLRYVGFAKEWDEIAYRGDPASGKFIAFYLANDRLLAAAGSGYDRELDAIEFSLIHDIPITPEQMRDPNFDLSRHIKQ